MAIIESARSESSEVSANLCHAPPLRRYGNDASGGAGVKTYAFDDNVSNDLDQRRGFQVLARRKIPKQNIVCRLQARETGSPSTPLFTSRHLSGTNLNRAHSFHACVLPNATVCDVAKPAISLRKFSPDGKFLLAFAFDFASVFIYRFKGAAAANATMTAKLKNSGASDCDVFNEVINDVEVRASAFDSFFALQHFVMLPPEAIDHFFRECSVFTSDGNHVILGTASALHGPGDSEERQDFQNAESLAPNPRIPLENFKLWILHIPTGVFTDHKTYLRDKIHLSPGNQGLSLYNDIVAVLSVQHQTVHILRVRGDGKFETLNAIGKFCHFHDERLWDRSFGGVGDVIDGQLVHREPFINGLKHRFLAHLFRSFRHDVGRLRHFYRIFDQLVNLKIAKMQLIDATTLLLKYSTEEAVTSRPTDVGSQPSFFMIYDFVSTEVHAIFEQDSQQLLDLYESFCDHFRHPASRFSSSISSSSFSRRLHSHLKAIITNARFGGSSEAIKRLLLQLPAPTQGFSPSPYLDMELFSYDEKMISPSERPKTPSEGAIRFYSRESGVLAFRLHTGFAASHSPANRGHAHHAKVVFHPHPNQPFVISVQRSTLDVHVLNFHFRYQHSGGE